MKYWLGKLIFPRFIWKNQCRFEEKQKDRFYDVIIPGNKIEDVASYLLSRALDKIKRALHWNWPLATVHCCRISDDIYIYRYIYFIFGANTMPVACAAFRLVARPHTYALLITMQWNSRVPQIKHPGHDHPNELSYKGSDALMILDFFHVPARLYSGVVLLFSLNERNYRNCDGAFTDGNVAFCTVRLHWSLCRQRDYIRT